MGLSTTVVLVLANILIAALRKIIRTACVCQPRLLS